MRRSTFRLFQTAAFLTFVAVLTPACGPITFTVGSSPADAEITTTAVHSDDGPFVADRVAIIDITGLIYNSRSRGFLSERENPVGLLHEKLEAARADRNVRAVILRLNTPGGTVTASDAMYREIERFKKLSKKPVVALMMDVTASGGYYVSCAADHVVAYPTSVTGSIGVIIQTISFKRAMDSVGIRAEAITSGPNKDAGSPFAEMNEEHRKVLRSMVDDFYGRFVDLVRRARPNIPDDQFSTVTDGRVMSGAEAERLGLVDRTGDLYDAFDQAKKLAGIERAQLVLYHREGDFAGSAYAAAPGAPAQPHTTQINIAQFNLDDTLLLGQTPAMFMYLWQPPLP